jgi:SAM-dependent methyltransferase
MNQPDREKLRETFTEDAELYNRARPGYPQRMFEDLARLASVTPRSRVLEIGCGAGQATLPMAAWGCEIVAVELGPELAAVARRNLSSFDRVEVVVAPFEDWPLPAERFDLVAAATSFHWVAPEVRMTKAAEALRPGGTLAVISTHHIAGGTEEFFVDVQDCYEKFDPDTPPDLRLPRASEVPEDSTEFDNAPEFGPVTFTRYEWQLTYTTKGYIDLVSTYSNHRALPADARTGLYRCIANLINKNHKGQITKRFMTQLATATVRKGTNPDRPAPLSAEMPGNE